MDIIDIENLKTDFFNNLGVKCSYCKSDDLEYQKEFNGLQWPVICLNCMGEFTEIYAVVDVEFTKIPNRKGA